MKFRIVTLASLLGLACLSMSGQQSVSMSKTAFFNGTTHDIGGSRVTVGTTTTVTPGAGCKTCHAPHNGSFNATTQTGNQATGQIMLWASNFAAAGTTYPVYSSSTLVNTATAMSGAPTSSSDARMYSLLCLSCHDGVTSTYTTMKQQNVVGALAANGLPAGIKDSFGLTNDHPVNIAYDTSGKAGLATITPVGTLNTVGGILPLYTGNTVQCSTCHDPHNNTNTNYLRQTDNALHCTTCHM